MKRIFQNNLLAAAVLLLTAACEENIVYHAYQSLPAGGWGKSDTLFFNVELNDSTPATFELFAEVRNRYTYPYQNLHLFISQNLEDSTCFQTDTLTLQLANDEGEWIGKGWGSLVQSTHTFRMLQSKQAGRYTLKVNSGMTDERLMGLSDIGLRIEKKK